MALHVIPADDGAPHAPDTSCGCGPQRRESSRRPDGHAGVEYVHTDMSADTERQEGPDHAAARP
jgi:hypothetical protein